MGQMVNKNILASSIGDLRCHPVTPLSDGTRAYVHSVKSQFYLDKTNGGADDGVNTIKPLDGNPIAGAADARWILCDCA